MKISIIVAIAENNAIGFKNQLLCHLPNDLKNFKKITSGKKVIMGRNTFISLPNGALPNRENIVISDNKFDKFENCTVVNSIDSAISKFDKEEENFIIGGASIYKQFLNLADKLYITKIFHNFEADTFFPEISENEWKLKEKIDNFKDDKHLYDYSFCIYERKK
jgi:dihydrofolate reductase